MDTQTIELTSTSTRTELDTASVPIATFTDTFTTTLTTTIQNDDNGGGGPATSPDAESDTAPAKSTSTDDAKISEQSPGNDFNNGPSMTVTATTREVSGTAKVVIFESPIIVENNSTSTIDGTEGTRDIATLDASAVSDALGGGSDDGTPAGAIAGAAVGGIVGGLLLGCLVAFLFLRKRKQQAPVIYETPESKSYGPSTSSATPPSDALQLNQFLALPTPDKELSSELRSLGDLIQAHVENNYHMQPTQPNPHAMVQALNNLGVGNNGGLAAEEVAGLAMEPRTRQAAIQHVLAHVLFTSVDFSSKSRLTMLPTPIAAFLQSIPEVERGGNQGAIDLALSRWRTLAAFLLNPTRSIRNTLTPSESSIAPQAAGLVSALNTFLGPFIPSNLQQQQADHLQAVILECAKLGYALFSQPSDWKFTFSSRSQPGYRMAVVCAGLEKLTSNEGQPYHTPNVIVAPTLVQL